MPEISGETAIKEDEAAPGGAEEGKMTGGERATEDMVVLDEPEVRDNPLGPSRLPPMINCSEFFELFFVGSGVP